MTDTAVARRSWVQLVDGYLHALAGTPPGEPGALDLVGEVVSTADAALVEVGRRNPAPFSWPAAAALDCCDAVGCYQQAADWAVFDLPLPADVAYHEVPTAEVTAGAHRLITAAHQATVALAFAAADPATALALADAAGLLVRALLTFPS